MTIYDVLDYARQNDCSDIHITVGTELAIRQHGELIFLQEKPAKEEAEAMIYEMLTEKDIAKVEAGKDIDTAFMLQDGGRVRINVYHQRNNLAASVRMFYPVIPSFKELGLPEVVRDFVKLPRGLVLITGPTGSGKTTTLASMLDYINHNMNKHIMTVEEPIEYIYKRDKSMIHQREVGKDCDNFAQALRSALREDPDIILVGEMRDYETIKSAVTAAETGHLVLSTLHTTSAAQTIDRIIDGCPANEQNQLRQQLSGLLQGVITQQLLPRADGPGRIIATEVLVVNYAIGNMIRENKSHMIPSQMQSNSSTGMHTMNMCLKDLYRRGIIAREVALKSSNNPSELEKLI